MNNPMAVGRLRPILVRWFDKHQRSFPWRNTRNPWRVLIAEMMLQRTKAEQVVEVYQDFFSKYKLPSDVINSSRRKLTKTLHPLGLRWRVANFRAVSLVLENEYNGKVPRTRAKLLQLPGVGEYVAGAVLSIAMNKSEWIVDSNVVRVFKRYYDLQTSKEGRRDRSMIELAKVYARCSNPRNANLALLDFAALVCKPRIPECGTCPLRRTCIYNIKFN